MLMFMINLYIDIYSYRIQRLYIYFFEAIHQSSFVYKFLQRVQIKIKSLVFTDYWAPKIQNFIHWILLESCKTNCFFQDERHVFKQLLALMWRCK